jgi:hypothetical protein
VAVVHPEYKGNSILFCKQVLLYILVTAPVLCFCLMGVRWLYLFSTLMVPAVPLIVFAGILISRAGKFSFDDEQRQIVKPFKKRISFQSIVQININETGRLMQVSVKQGFLRWIPLSYALDSKDKQRLKEDLHKRFPHLVIREKRYVDWKSIGVILTFIVLLTGGFHLYLYRSNEALNVVPRQVTWTAPEPHAANKRLYNAGNFSIALPGRFQLNGMDVDALQFEDRKDKTEIKCIAKTLSATPGPRADLIAYASGIRDYYDVLKTAYSSQLGIIPLVLKDMTLAGLTDVIFFEIRLITPPPRIEKKNNTETAARPVLNGFLLQGKKGENEIASLFFTDSERKEQLHIFLSGSKRLDEKRLQEIAAGIRLRTDRQISSP